MKITIKKIFSYLVGCQAYTPEDIFAMFLYPVERFRCPRIVITILFILERKHLHGLPAKISCLVLLETRVPFMDNDLVDFLILVC